MKPTEYTTGEQFVQEITGESYIAIRNAAIVADRLSPGAIRFIMGLPFFFIATQDGQGKLWASVVSGKTGFLNVVDERQLLFYPQYLTSNIDDICWENIKFQSGIGMLFIDLSTRVRFRLNGYLIKEKASYNFEIIQAYPNCPKYIQKRELSTNPNKIEPIGEDLRKWIKQADTFFVASSNKYADLDVSHRGGHPGFIEWIDSETLRIPDYEGNSMFMTLGNFHDNPVAGLLFIDFNTGDTLQITGSVDVHFNADGFEDFTGGTNRFWDFKIGDIKYGNSLPGFSAELLEYSRFNP
jgi:predicted pyridoxine 5'-phosphate oxidase superfamily flavin-nucleotide-binding protein